MKYTGKPIATTFQHGQTVFAFKNGLPIESTVSKTRSRGKVVSGVLVNTNTYQLTGFPDWFAESEIFVSKAAAEAYMDSKIDAL